MNLTNITNIIYLHTQTGKQIYLNFIEYPIKNIANYCILCLEIQAHSRPAPVYLGYIPPQYVSALNIPQGIHGNQEPIIQTETNLREGKEYIAPKV